LGDSPFSLHEPKYDLGTGNHEQQQAWSRQCEQDGGDGVIALASKETDPKAGGNGDAREHHHY